MQPQMIAANASAELSPVKKKVWPPRWPDGTVRYSPNCVYLLLLIHRSSTTHKARSAVAAHFDELWEKLKGEEECYLVLFELYKYYRDIFNKRFPQLAKESYFP